MYLPAYTRLLLDMHKQRPISGDYLSTGKQTVPWTYQQAKEFLSAEGIATRELAADAIHYDLRTVERIAGGIDDVTFFALFCDARVRSMDASSYEGADIIHNLCDPVPPELHDSADFIFEGSCLDDCFNPAQLMLNVDRMLRVGGRLFMVNLGTVTNIPGPAYAVCSVDWYTEFLEVNGYTEICVQVWSYVHVADQTWHPGPMMSGTPAMPSLPCCITVSASKVARVLPQLQPMRKGYRDMHERAA